MSLQQHMSSRAVLTACIEADCNVSGIHRRGVWILGYATCWTLTSLNLQYFVKGASGVLGPPCIDRSRCIRECTNQKALVGVFKRVGTCPLCCAWCSVLGSAGHAPVLKSETDHEKTQAVRPMNKNCVHAESFKNVSDWCHGKGAVP